MSCYYTNNNIRISTWIWNCDLNDRMYDPCHYRELINAFWPIRFKNPKTPAVYKYRRIEFNKTWFKLDLVNLCFMVNIWKAESSRAWCFYSSSKRLESGTYCIISPPLLQFPQSNIVHPFSLSYHPFAMLSSFKAVDRARKHSKCCIWHCALTVFCHWLLCVRHRNMLIFISSDAEKVEYSAD